MALETITVPVDGSEFSARAIPLAEAIAQRAGAKVTPVQVASEPGDPDPVAVLLNTAEDPATILCLASHDHLPPAAAIRHSVGSKIIEHARRPLLVVGPVADASALGEDVVVAVDGKHDPGPLLAVAVAWAATLHAPLRVATVYEPVLADVRDPDHFTRTHGPPSDPLAYLEDATRGIEDVDLVAIPDPVSVAVGLAEHLQERPALVVVSGGQRPKHHPWPGVVRELVRCLHEPVLVVPGPAPESGWLQDASASGIDVGTAS